MQKVALLFSGQGSQFIGMGNNFFDQYQVVRQTFEEASEVLGRDMAKLCFEGRLVDLCRMNNLQAALLTVCSAMYRVFVQEYNYNIDFYAGHSLGEFAALSCSGAISFADALRIAEYRGKLVEDVTLRGEYSMTIVDGIESKIVEEVCSTVSNIQCYAQVSCYNSRTQSAISGHQKVVEKVEKILLDRGAKTTPLIMSPPLHCAIMKPTANEFYKEIDKYKFRFSRKPVIANVNALPYSGIDEIKKLLKLQLYKPVQWERVIKFLIRHGADIFVEISPKNMMCGLFRKDYENRKAYCFGQKEDREALKRNMLDLQPYRDVFSFITKCMVAAVSTPNTNNTINEYKMGVIEPYNKLKEMQVNLKNEKLLRDEKLMKESLSLLSTIFMTKKVDIDEQLEWYLWIIEESGSYYVIKDLEKYVVG